VGDDWGRLRSGACVRARRSDLYLRASRPSVRPAEREREKEDGRGDAGVRSFRYQIPRQDTRLR